MSTRRRVLLVTKNDFRAERDGGSKRTAAAVRALESAGYQVDWVAVRPFASSTDVVPRRLTWAERVVAFQVVAAALRTASLSVLKWQSVAALRRIVELVACNPYEVLVIEHSQLAPYGLVGNAAVKCVDMHNIESELLENFATNSGTTIESTIGRYESRRMRAVEAGLPRKFDIVVTVSERDRQWLCDGSPSSEARVIVAPNGISEDFFGVAGEPTNDVVFIGHLGWRPNVDAAQWLVDEVWPLVEAEESGLQLKVIGLKPDPRVIKLSNGRVQVCGDVASVLPYLQAARVATAPLLSAGGTRIKILEALAAGVPVVSTTMGALGLEALAGEHLVIVDSPEDFAAAIRRLSQEKVDRSAVRALVEGYSWNESLGPFIAALATHSHDGVRR